MDLSATVETRTLPSSVVGTVARFAWIASCWAFLISLGFPWGEATTQTFDGRVVNESVTPGHLLAYFWSEGDFTARFFVFGTIVLPIVGTAMIAALETRRSTSRWRLVVAAASAFAVVVAAWPNTRWILASWPAHLRLVLSTMMLLPVLAIGAMFVVARRRKMPIESSLSRLMLGHTLTSLVLLFSAAAWRSGFWMGLVSAGVLFVTAPWIADGSSEWSLQKRFARTSSMSALVWFAGFAFITLSERK